MIVPFVTAASGGEATPPKTIGVWPGTATSIAIACALAEVFAAGDAPAAPVPRTSASSTSPAATRWTLTAPSMRPASGGETALHEVAEAGARGLVGSEALLAGVARVGG